MNKPNLVVAKWATESAYAARKTTRILLQILDEFGKSGLDRGRIEVTCPDVMRMDAQVKARDELIQKMFHALETASNELGVTQPEYPAPMANANEAIKYILNDTQLIAWKERNYVFEKTETSVSNDDGESKPVV